MKDFNLLSGPWAGFSVQDGLHISETMELTIRQGIVSGLGFDKDGDFVLTGDYNEKNQQVRLTRRYSRTTEPSQEGAGIPYDYSGFWDGTMVAGTWHFRYDARMCGIFEMWPQREEDRIDAFLEIEAREEVASR